MTASYETAKKYFDKAVNTYISAKNIEQLKTASQLFWDAFKILKQLKDYRKDAETAHKYWEMLDALYAFNWFLTNLPLQRQIEELHGHEPQFRLAEKLYFGTIWSNIKLQKTRFVTNKIKELNKKLAIVKKLRKV